MTKIFCRLDVLDCIHDFDHVFDISFFLISPVDSGSVVILIAFLINLVLPT